MKRVALLAAIGMATACMHSEGWRREEPKVAVSVGYTQSPLVRGRLPNGVGVYSSHLEHPATTRVALVFGLGYGDDGANLGRARLVARWLEFESVGEQAELFELLGAEVNTRVLPFATVVEVDVLHEDANAAMLALLRLVQDAGDELAFESARRGMSSALALARRNPATLVELAALQAALPDHALQLGRRGLGSVEALERARLEDAIDLRDRWLSSAPASLVVVGPQDPGVVARWASDALSGWSNRGRTRTFADGVQRQLKSIIVVPFSGLEPALVFVGTAAPWTNPAAHYAFSAGRSFAHFQLREMSQHTYGVKGDFENLGHTGFAHAAAWVPTSAAYGSATAIAGAFPRSRRTVTESASRQRRLAEAAFWTAAGVETEARAAAIYEAVEFGEDVEARPPFGPRGAAPSVDDIQRSLLTEFSYDGMQIVIAGDRGYLSHALCRTSFEVRTDVDLLGPEELPEEAPAEPATTALPGPNSDPP